MRSERGQAIFLIVFALVALLAITGLAIDGGQAYRQRRQVQNAADAAALAGTRALYGEIVEDCKTGSYQPQDSKVAEAVLSFIQNNGVNPDFTHGRVEAWYVDKNQTPLLHVGTGTIPNGATGVRVSAVITGPSSFSKIIGQDNLVTLGDATAMGGNVSQISGGNILPIAVPDEAVIGMNPGDEFNIENDMYCKTHGTEECFGVSGDPSSQRGWLDFNYIYNTEHYSQGDALRRTIRASSNANDIRDYIIPPSMGGKPSPPIFPGTPPNPLPPAPAQTVYIDGDFIHGVTGEKTTDGQAVFDNWAGQEVFLPVFDKAYGPEYLDDRNELFPDPYVNSGPRWPTGNSALLYHIVGFVAVDVCNPQTDSDCNNNNEQKDLVGTFKEVIIGQGQVNPGGGIGTCRPGIDIFAVSLWK